MKIAQKYSHRNGEEYLLVHHKHLYEELQEVIAEVDAEKCRTKVSREKRKMGNTILSPVDLNAAFQESFNKRGWNESRYNYYITLDRDLMEQSVPMTAHEQKDFLVASGELNPIRSYNQTDFVKEKVCLLYTSRCV